MVVKCLHSCHDPNLKGPVYCSKPMSIVSLNLALGLFTVVRGTRSSRIDCTELLG